MDLSRGGYVFLSHSHQDIQKVRQIRNAMEEAGFEPLCFYLKCLSDDDEIEGLIKREIDAREWFVYLDSQNARSSSWVTRERKYIESLSGKQIITISLESETPLQEVSAKLIRGLRICIISHPADEALAEEFRRLFEEKETQVSVRIVRTAEEPITEDEAGCIIPLLSRNGIRTEHLNTLFSMIDGNQSMIIPVLTGEYTDARSEINSDSRYPHVFLLSDRNNLSLREEIVRRIEAAMTNDLRKAFGEARSHNEVESYHLDHPDDPEAARLAQEAHDRLDEERRIREDIEEQLERGTMKMTPELKKYLDSLY